jgi:O-antigen/teichoic acid export membrane protein
MPTGAGRNDAKYSNDRSQGSQLQTTLPLSILPGRKLDPQRRLASTGTSAIALRDEAFIRMSKLKATFSHLMGTAVFWSWLMNGLRLTSGIVVLPLLVLKLSKPDYGMYFVFLSLASLAPVLDLGFAASIGRAVNYAMGGAKKLQALGVAPELGTGVPNQTMLWQLLHATRHLYRLLAAAVIGLVGLGGTLFIWRSVPETSCPELTWAAWFLTVAAIAWEIYSGWWNVYLRNMNQVRTSAQQAVAAQLVKIILICTLLLGNAGLLSVPIATLCAGFVQRFLARRVVQRLLARDSDPGKNPHEVKAMLATLWPNSWRVGVHFFGGYLAGQANTLICLSLLGLAASAEYGFSLQLILICSGMAQVWTAVKWPQVGQLRIRQDSAAVRRLLWPRLWLQYVTYVILALCIIVIVPALLRWQGSDKTLLPGLWLSLLALNGLFEMNCIFWCTLIATENRLPMVWPMLISNLVSIGLIIILVNVMTLGLAALVLAPLMVGLTFNYWKWPREGARSMGTTCWHFLFRNPA